MRSSPVSSTGTTNFVDGETTDLLQGVEVLEQQRVLVEPGRHLQDGLEAARIPLGLQELGLPLAFGGEDRGLLLAFGPRDRCLPLTFSGDDRR